MPAKSPPPKPQQPRSKQVPPPPLCGMWHRRLCVSASSSVSIGCARADKPFSARPIPMSPSSHYRAAAREHHPTVSPKYQPQPTRDHFQTPSPARTTPPTFPSRKKKILLFIILSNLPVTLLLSTSSLRPGGQLKNESSQARACQGKARAC